MSTLPNLTIPEALERARAHHHAGRLSQAESIYRRILIYDPNNAEVINLLGTLAMQSGHSDAAVDLVKRAIALSPANPEYLNNLGIALLNGGHAKEAIDILQQAAAISPRIPYIYFNLGNALKAIGRLDDAIKCYEQTLALDPVNIGALNNMGTALKNCGRIDQAIASFRRLLEIDPNLHWAHNNLGESLRRRNDLEGAEACWRRAIEINGEYPTAHWNLGTLLLLQGKFQEGWEQYAWRSREGHLGFLSTELPAPQWDGSLLEGKTILLQAEQGLGDTIQFVRFLPMVRQLDGKIVFACDPDLALLFRGQFEVEQWVTSRDDQPACDVQCLLLRLPMLLGTNLKNIPAPVPYLAAPPAAREKWKQRLAAHPGLKVGIAWAGKPAYSDDRNRSMNFFVLAPLLQLPDVALVSLQKGDASQQIAGNSRIFDWTAELADFSQTAGLIANLDLVITVDTAVAHLAGAMGKPVWTLLPYAPDWRWMLDRTDTPWYPTMRLFRQQRMGDWSEPIEQVTRSLQGLPQGRRSSHIEAMR
jgi:tetratricopeptide (TPR) repeat protein